MPLLPHSSYPVKLNPDYAEKVCSLLHHTPEYVPPNTDPKPLLPHCQRKPELGPKVTGPAKKAGWGETAVSEGEGEESLATTLGGFASLVSTSSSLPSFAAASQMEEEDEEEIKRSLRETQDGKKVRRQWQVV